MSGKNGSKGLGRGFGSLIPTEWVDDGGFESAVFDEVSGAGEHSGAGMAGELRELEIEKLERDVEQPRREFDEEALAELADSIREHGVLQPIVAVKNGDKYKIVAGERRWRAAKIAGLLKVPVIVRTMDDQKRLLVSVIENAQREDLNAIELATAYARLSTQFNLGVSEVAKKVGKSEASIANVLRLLNLPEGARKIMVERKLTEGVVRPLVGLSEEVIMKVLPRVADEGWSARKVEEYVKNLKPKSSSAAVKTMRYIKQEERLSEKYAAQAKIKGKTVSFVCKNEKELLKLLEKL